MITSASARSSASTARRCSPCEPKLRSSRVAARDHDVVEVRTESGRAALEVAVEPFDERGRGRRRPVVAQLRLFEPELAGPLGEGRLQERQHLAARGDELRSELGGLLRPRLQSGSCGKACGDPAQRRISLRHNGAVVDRQLCARRRGPAESAVEVGAPHGGCALDDPEPVGGEGKAAAGPSVKKRQKAAGARMKPVIRAGI